jgi:nucleoid-associated protein YgaU
MLRRLTVSVSALILLALAGCQPIDKNLEAEDSHNPYFKKAEGFMEAKNYVDAAKQYEAALQANPNVALAHYELGNIYSEKLGDEISAMYHYSKFLELRPTSEKREQVLLLLENAKYTLATKLPNTPIANAEVFARVQSENANLKKQLEDAQSRLARMEQVQQDKDQQKESAPVAATPAPAAPSTPAVSTAAPSTPTTVPSPIRPGTATPAPSAPPKPVAPTAPTVTTTPAAPAAPAPTAPTEARSHTIARGDTLWSIAKKYYKNDTVNGIEKIKAANADKLGDGKPLKIGTTLVIP